MRERTVMRGMARLFWRDFCELATPSTLWESGHFYFAPTVGAAGLRAIEDRWYDPAQGSSRGVLFGTISLLSSSPGQQIVGTGYPGLLCVRQHRPSRSALSKTARGQQSSQPFLPLAMNTIAPFGAGSCKTAAAHSPRRRDSWDESKQR